MKLVLIELVDRDGQTLDSRSTPVLDEADQQMLVSTVMQVWSEVILRHPGSTVRVSEYS
jgi:hypothetical protein